MRKLIVITSSLYIRNYIETSAFSEIKDKDTFIICSKDISNKDSIVNYGNFAGEFGVSKIKEALFNFITLLLMYSNREINKGFYFYFKIRNTTIYFPSLRLKRKANDWCSNTFCQFFIIHILEFIRPFFQPVKLLKFSLIVMIDFFGLTNGLVKLYRKTHQNNSELITIFDKVKPDLILIPSGGLDSYANDVIFTSNLDYQSKTAFLIDNWDNLCSKSRFPISPDYLCVWGEQAKSHAINFHDFDPFKIFLAGSPRFDVYYEYQDQETKVRGECQEVVNFPYILFAGCWPTFDEIGVLEILNELIYKYKDLLPNQCKILYRPHPWGENYDKLDYLESLSLENVKVDPQMSKKSRPADYTKRTDFQPDLDYYPVLLDNSEFVICPLSSIIIEASIMNKKVLALAHDDKKSLLTPSLMYKNSDYFDRFSDMKNLSLLHELSNLDKEFFKMINSSATVNEKALGYYIVDSKNLYPERILNITNKMNELN